MASISTTDFKKGLGLKINGKYYTITEFQHVKPGKRVELSYVTPSKTFAMDALSTRPATLVLNSKV